ncbi:hypothetical protein LFL96_36885 (plasmid) [Paraburkholderia sp. D15]|uniref:hypothetical protein n=1 Tax=Paraburkholderia sp. D15 TaxID=2880218 RepID=UPI0024792B51|nr:hypothetical protein [Paraburkholderia sp. D15]WGS55055.1 hypothetical protein LFL96_36885 [Paraburkholderia sp. D15]
MILIPHCAVKHTLSEVTDLLYATDYRRPVARGLLETVLQADGFLSPDLLPVVHAFLVSIRRGCEEVGFFVEEKSLHLLISNLEQCIEDSENYDTEFYCREQRESFARASEIRPDEDSVIQ